MPQQQSSKGNPASRRMMNARLKARRQACWARGERRKEQNRADNEMRAAHNRSLRAAGELTPHEAQRLRRRKHRDDLRAAGLLPPLGMTRTEWDKSRNGGGQS